MKLVALDTEPEEGAEPLLVGVAPFFLVLILVDPDPEPEPDREDELDV